MRAISLLASVGRLHIVAIAALGTLTFGWAFTGERPWLVAAVSALDWFLVNLLNRVVDLPEDRANGIHGADFVSEHRRPILVGGFGLLGASLVAVHAVAPELLGLRFAYHALGLAYNWPLLPGGRRIKQLYFWKNTASALGFVLTVFLYPLASAGFGRTQGTLAPGVGLGTFLYSGTFFVLFELSYEVIYDLRDVHGDALAAVATYPVVHGAAGAVRIIDGLLGGSLVTLAIGFATGHVPWRIAIMFAAPLVQVGVYKRAYRRGITSRDCVLLTWLGAGLLATYHLWVAAKLPGVELG
ncbi:MAG: UbiA family prenyltransferase [Deltaproteobacteria bacterium]|nr:UbiA family prenyltransferase [Deltaproteobacteria bacterium]